MDDHRFLCPAYCLCHKSSGEWLSANCTFTNWFCESFLSSIRSSVKRQDMYELIQKSLGIHHDSWYNKTWRFHFPAARGPFFFYSIVIWYLCVTHFYTSKLSRFLQSNCLLRHTHVVNVSPPVFNYSECLRPYCLYHIFHTAIQIGVHVKYTIISP